MKNMPELSRYEERELIKLLSEAAENEFFEIPESDGNPESLPLPAHHSSEPGDMELTGLAALADPTSRTLSRKIKSYMANGFQVWGVAASPRHRKALRQYEIAAERITSFNPLIQKIMTKSNNFGAKAVVVVEDAEAAVPICLLEMARLQKKRRFKVILVGRAEACIQASAYPARRIMRQVFGTRAVAGP